LNAKSRHIDKGDRYHDLDHSRYRFQAQVPFQWSMIDDQWSMIDDWWWICVNHELWSSLIVND
jgi:hypothetical protein